MNSGKTAQATVGQMTTGSVTSTDGTPIGYLRAGRGPAVVVLHGSNESARSHTQLALALADAFTVYLPDRRGRGLSGPHRPDHGMHTEVEDLQAVVAHSGAQVTQDQHVMRTEAPQLAGRPVSNGAKWPSLGCLVSGVR